MLWKDGGAEAELRKDDLLQRWSNGQVTFSYGWHVGHKDLF